MSLPLDPNDNRATPAPAAVVGFKISKPGYDANKTSGSNLVFDSSWPSLPIALEITIDNTYDPVTKPVITVPHNLGFPPFAMCWLYGSDPFLGNVGTAPYGIRFLPATDKKNIYITELVNTPNLQAGTKIRIMVFNLDISTDIDYTLAPGDTFKYPYDNNFGVKIVKPNRDITSTDMRDFAVHSRGQSPLILAVKTQATVDPANTDIISYTNETTNPVWVYGYIWASSAGLAGTFGLPDGTYIPAPYYEQAYPVLFTDGFKSYLEFVSPDYGASLVILRDPMFASNQITAVY